MKNKIALFVGTLAIAILAYALFMPDLVETIQITDHEQWVLVILVLVVPIGLVYLAVTGLESIPPGMWGFTTAFGGPPDQDTVILGPGPFFRMLWESKYLYYLTPQEVDVPGIKVSIGGDTPEEAVVNATVFVKAEGPAVWHAPNHDPYQYAADLAYTAITAHLSGWGANRLFNADKRKIAAGITRQLQQEFSGPGPNDPDLETRVRVQIEDIDVPNSVLSRSSLILKAQGEAQASETLSKQEVENYRREKEVEGTDYMHRQVLDAIRETIINAAEAGGIKALSLNFGQWGGNAIDAGTGYLVAREVEKDEQAG